MKSRNQMVSSGISRLVVRMWTEVSEERIASILRVENQPRKKPACSMWLGRFTYGLHNAISQKMTTFVTTVVRTSDPTNNINFTENIQFWNRVGGSGILIAQTVSYLVWGTNWSSFEYPRKSAAYSTFISYLCWISSYIRGIDSNRSHFFSCYGATLHHVFFFFPSKPINNTPLISVGAGFT
jgi:hypothetical protein